MNDKFKSFINNDKLDSSITNIDKLADTLLDKAVLANVRVPENKDNIKKIIDILMDVCNHTIDNIVKSDKEVPLEISLVFATMCMLEKTRKTPHAKNLLITTLERMVEL